jgi:hypothetical protein
MPVGQCDRSRNLWSDNSEVDNMDCIRVLVYLRNTLWNKDEASGKQPLLWIHLKRQMKTHNYLADNGPSFCRKVSHARLCFVGLTAMHVACPIAALRMVFCT